MSARRSRRDADNAGPDLDAHRLERTRRHFFRDCGVGVGKIALATLLAESQARTAWAGAEPDRSAPRDVLAPRPPHFAPKARRVIFLFMAGAPSQLDLFDDKPTLRKFDGRPIPAEVVKDQRYAFIRPDASLMSARYRFARHGQCGAELSEMLPHLAKVVDEIAIVQSMHTDQFNHAPAQIFLNTGSPLPGRPSMGAWVSYGLGSESVGPAGLRRLILGVGHQRRRGQLVQRLPADVVPGRAVPHQGRPDPGRRQPVGRRSRGSSATRST